jgi:hypothetical protein
LPRQLDQEFEGQVAESSRLAFRIAFIEDVWEQKIDQASLESLFEAADSTESAEIAPMPIAGLEPIDIKPLNPAVTERGGSL